MKPCSVTNPLLICKTIIIKPDKKEMTCINRLVLCIADTASIDLADYKPEWISGHYASMIPGAWYHGRAAL